MPKVNRRILKKVANMWGNTYQERLVELLEYLKENPQYCPGFSIQEVKSYDKLSADDMFGRDCGIRLDDGCWIQIDAKSSEGGVHKYLEKNSIERFQRHDAFPIALTLSASNEELISRLINGYKPYPDLRDVKRDGIIQTHLKIHKVLAVVVEKRRKEVEWVLNQMRRDDGIRYLSLRDVSWPQGNLFCYKIVTPHSEIELYFNLLVHDIVESVQWVPPPGVRVVDVRPNIIPDELAFVIRQAIKQ